MNTQPLIDPAEIAFFAAWSAAGLYRPGAKDLLPLAIASEIYLVAKNDRGRIIKLGNWIGRRREITFSAPDGGEYLIRDGGVLLGRQRWLLITKNHQAED